MKVKVTISILVLVILMLYIILYKQNVSLQTIKIDKIDVQEKNITFMLSTSSSLKDTLQYNYTIEDENLYVIIYKTHLLNPFSCKTEMHVNVNTKGKKISRVYIQSGNENKMILEKNNYNEL